MKKRNATRKAARKTSSVRENDKNKKGFRTGIKAGYSIFSA